MDAPTPQPDNTLPAPEAAAVPTPQGPRCALCGEPVAGNRGASWQRRLTADELAEHVALEQQLRDRALLLADPQLPPPVFPPLPDGSNDTRLIVACGIHAINMGPASQIHQATCTAPNAEHLPDCDCTPEPLPEVADVPDESSQLPDHWQTGGD